MAKFLGDFRVPRSTVRASSDDWPTAQAGTLEAGMCSILSGLSFVTLGKLINFSEPQFHNL